MPPDRLLEPWLPFLTEIDRRATSRVDLVCIGGFAVTVAYGAPRTTADLDVLWTAHDPSATAALAPAQSDLRSSLLKKPLDPGALTAPPKFR